MDSLTQLQKSLDKETHNMHSINESPRLIQIPEEPTDLKAVIQEKKVPEFIKKNNNKVRPSSAQIKHEFRSIRNSTTARTNAAQVEIKKVYSNNEHKEIKIRPQSGQVRQSTRADNQLLQRGSSLKNAARPQSGVSRKTNQIMLPADLSMSNLIYQTQQPDIDKNENYFSQTTKTKE